MTKKIRLPKKETSKLFKFLDDNNLGEYTLDIKNTSANEIPSKKQKHNYSLKLKREKPTEYYWIFMITLGAFIFYKVYKMIDIGITNDTLNSWEMFFIIFGIVGSLIFLDGILKVIINWKNKWIHINEDKLYTNNYNSNLEKIK